MSMAKLDHVVIMGAGGMGALFGTILQEGGLEITLVDTNQDHINAINNHGLRIVGFGGERTVKIPATTVAAAVPAADVVFFQCKAHASADAAAASKHLIEGGAVAISFQNGLGNEQTIGDVVGGHAVLGGLTAMAGALEAPGVIRDFSRVPSYIGEMPGGISERVTKIADALTKAGLETHASDNIVEEIWKKLLANISMSALSGATNLSSAALLEIPELKRVSLQAMDEAFAVGRAAGIDLDINEARKSMAMISAAGGTGDNKSSLAMDLLNSRPTEVAYIYGSVIELGRSHGIETPTLNTLHAIVKGLEHHYL